MSTAAPGQSRKTVVAGDPIRGSVILWDRQGRLPGFTQGFYGQPTYKLVPAAGASIDLLRRDPGKDASWFDPLYHGEVQIPVGVAPGSYKIVAGPVEYPIQVIALPKRNVTQVLSPGADLTTAQKALDGGYDLRLNPGVYAWGRSIYYADPKDAPLRLPRGVTITGPGAVIRPDPKVIPPKPGDEWQVAAFVGGEWAVLDGLTFDLPPGYRVTQANTAPNLSLVKCRLTCDVNQPGESVYMDRCEVDGGWVFITAGGLLRRVRFTGNTDSFGSWVADHNLAAVDVTCDRTRRGPIFQATWGDVRGNLFLGVHVFDVCWAENGCESFLCECPGPYGFHDNLILHYRLRTGAGGGSAVQWDRYASGNLVKEAKAFGGWGVVLGWGIDASGIHDNTFEEVELAGGARLTFGAGTSNNVFRGGAAVAFHPASWNEFYFAPDWFSKWDAIAWWDAAAPPGPGNGFEDFYFAVGPQYRVAADPSRLTFTRCLADGQPFPPPKTPPAR